MNFDVDKLFVKLNQTHLPYMAAVCRSTQSLRADGIGSVGNGANAYEAVWSAFGNALLTGHVTKDGWIAVVCRFGRDGYLVDSDPIDQQAMDVLTKDGMHTIFYVHADGTME